jgi:competence protein ComEC
MWVAIFLLPPLGLFLLWKYRKLNNPIKIISTVIIVIYLIGYCSAWASSPPKDSSTIKTQSNNAITLKPQATDNTITVPLVQPIETTTNSGNSQSVLDKQLTNAIMTVKFFDVGQGDSILIQTPNGKTMLIDAGPGSASDKVYSALKSLNINSIDVLVATHPHEDHIGGMTNIVNNLKIGMMYMPKSITTTKTYESLLNAISNKGLKVNTAKAGVVIDIDSALSVTMLTPNSANYTDINDYSAVIKITYKNNSFLLVGDASNNSESEMLSNGSSLKADVLKVGHHGSATSSSDSFLSAVNPKYAIISVGAGNSYGHPTAATLGRLSSHNINVYRTDESGTITMTSDGSVIKLDKSASPIKPQAPPVVNNPVVVNPTVKPNGGNDIIVYRTDTGAKYHIDGCSYLSKSKVPISLKDAKAMGLTACSKCHPPE